MTKVSAGVLTGIVLGAATGLAGAWGEPRVMDVFTSVLGRASQGIITGVLTAYATPGRTPIWRGALLGAAIGLALGGLAGISERNWVLMVPAGGAIGLLCGIATSRAGR
jgi:hypothetical protein